MEKTKRSKELELFLKELTQLTMKYQFEIYGCGCCGSPIVRDIKRKNGKEFCELTFNKETKKYMFN